MELLIIILYDKDIRLNIDLKNENYLIKDKMSDDKGVVIDTYCGPQLQYCMFMKRNDSICYRQYDVCIQRLIKSKEKKSTTNTM